MPDNYTLEACSADGDLLVLEFAWRGDRYGHEFRGGLGADDLTMVARSREGTPDNDWPPSPPFQQCHVESRDGGRRIALLVGMSGSSHWSASVEPLDGQAGFLFDVACRVRSAPPYLGSEYTFPGFDTPESAHRGHVEIAAEMPAECQAGRIVAPSAPATLPTTIRWRYRLLSAPKMISKTTRYEIDGARITNLDEFFDEVSRVLIPDVPWGRNLDALDDVLAGGFGTPADGFALHWHHSNLSRERLGYAETVRQLERRLASCHPTNRHIVAQELDDARRQTGPTVFDWLVGIIGAHRPKNDRPNGGVELYLE